MCLYFFHQRYKLYMANSSISMIVDIYIYDQDGIK